MILIAYAVQPSHTRNIFMMAWIPKRAVGHSVHLPEEESPCLTSKPGAVACAPYELRETSQREPFNSSEYKSSMNSSSPETYAASLSDRVHRPHQTRCEPIACASDSYTTTYGATFSSTANEILLSKVSKVGSCKPVRVNREKVVGDGEMVTAYACDYGCSTSAIRSNFIPGYQGFVPNNVHNPLVKAYSSFNRREVRDSSHIVDNYHVHLPGYSGHVPVDVRNDRGPRQITTSTTYGSAYTI